MENLNLTREVLENYNLSNKHLFKKRAGNAKYYYQLQYDKSLDKDLKELSRLYQDNQPFKIFGVHTNLYITEKGYNGLFIDISAKFTKIRFDKETEEFTVSSNVFTSQLVNYTMKLGYDFASLTGIPGMVGSGVVSNASWIPAIKDYGAYVKKIILFDFEKGEEISIFPDSKSFSTRNSFIKQANREKTRYFVKELILKSEYIGSDKVREKYLEQINKRKESLRIGFTEGCAGSLWSNIDLKQKIGKTFRIIVSETTDFNVNYNGARYSTLGSRFFTTDLTTTDKDVAKLFKFTIDNLQELYNVKPHKEVVILDYDGEIDVETFINRNINN